jgi:transposase
MRAKAHRQKLLPKNIPAQPSKPLSIVHPNAAGLDIGKEEIFVAVPPDRDAQPVRAYPTFTPDLLALADWLQACQIDTVALESTGVYWIPIFELLEARGLKCFLVNATHLKRVPGRKSDVQDCQWLQQCHSFGLLAGSFRPDSEMLQLRTYLRHRAELIERRSPYVLHMQKALHQMNLQLDVVLSDIMGLTGQAILRAILAGERDPVTLARLRHPNCHSSQETIAKALTGSYRDDYLFALRQSMELYDFYTDKIAQCDAEVERCFSAIKPRHELIEEAPQATPLARKKRDSHSKNEPSGNTRQHVVRITGVDFVATMGLSNSLVQTILAEVGTDMSKWPTAKHFASWLGLSPRNDISGGKVLRSRTFKVRNRAAQAFRLAARSVAQSNSALGAFYRRLRARIGPAQALVATAHKMARIFYIMLKERKPYEHTDAQRYEEQFREREVKNLQRKAAKLGFALDPLPA